MICLNKTTESIKIILDSIPTNEIIFYIYYAETTTTTFTEKNNYGLSSGTTLKTIIPSPSVIGDVLTIKEILLFNNNTTTTNGFIYIDDGTTLFPLYKFEILANSTLKIN